MVRNDSLGGSVKDTPENRRIASLNLRLTWDRLVSACDEVLSQLPDTSKEPAPSDPVVANYLEPLRKAITWVRNEAEGMADLADKTAREFAGRA